MKIKYQIVEVHPDEHQIVVRFYTDKVPIESLVTQRDPYTGAIMRCRTDYAISLPIPAPTGEALHALIMRSAPADFFHMKECVCDPSVDTSLNGVRALMGKEFTGEKTPGAKIPQPVDNMGIVMKKRPSADRVEVTEL
ncbi:MAG TPA: hypothetical protein VF193_14145 [Steroidobacter sp.]